MPLAVTAEDTHILGVAGGDTCHLRVTAEDLCILGVAVRHC